MTPTTKNLFLVLFLISTSLPVLLSQPPQTPPPPPNATCNGVFLSYTYTNGFPIPPTDPTNQGYRFESTVTVLNNGRDELKSWRVFVGFHNDEILVSATDAVLADGTSLPALVGNGTVLAGFPRTDLKTAIETAGDLTQMEARIQLVGTQFGEPNVSLPANLTLLHDDYSCPNPTTQGREMHLCCLKSPSSKPDITLGDSFLPRQDGDLIIMYDVISSQSTFYWAQVSISNHNPLSRLDSWKLSWEWKRDEFIYAMKGAYPTVVDTTNCLFGRQGQYYQQMDFSQALNCQKMPTIVDLPLTMANDTNLGKIPFCCRNGTILPPEMDPTKSLSAFQMQVFKMEPDLNKSVLFPPQNWKINGTLSSDFQCGSPVPVSPSLFPDLSGLPSRKSAVSSWQIVCNITHSKQETPKCCVSFSSFLNDSVIPCSTCACGCTKNPTQTCSTSEPALLLPSEALLLPFDNRTRKALAFAKLKRTTVPNPLPCGDNCGVSINWHLLTDHKDGWTARITVFNWGRTDFADWFTAVEMDKAGPGFEEVYSFNGTALPGSNSTIFMHGLVNRNFLLAEQDSSRPRKDPPIPGSQQSVILFSKKKTPGINVAGRDGFPTRVIFNGEECALPRMLPSSSSRTMAGVISIFGLLIALLPTLLMQ